MDAKKWGISYEEFIAGAADFDNDRDWLASNLDRLRKRYLNKWVAIRKRRIVDSDNDYRALIDRPRSSFTDDISVVIDFVGPEDVDLVL